MVRPPFLFHHPKAVNVVEQENERFHEAVKSNLGQGKYKFRLPYYTSIIRQYSTKPDVGHDLLDALAFSGVVDVFSIEALGTKAAEELNNYSSLWLRLNSANAMDALLKGASCEDRLERLRTWTCHRD
ncbi:hypothetical protein RHGRI_015540 [Rhododendron griersonianum]|uniref:Uncharacterized protein n=1 Tax=Rhododendron griersonianum TaxID=479676 RepID=A0AAV6KDP7_9ERIC|nr:hypothetical protein RHGRI_015540 [Rhododendron griersonianum]